MIKKLLIILTSVLSLSHELQAQSWVRIATCMNSEATAGADLYIVDGQLVLQTSAVAEQLDEYRSNLGQLRTVAINPEHVRANLARGQEQSLLLTKATSREDPSGVVSDAVLFTLQTPRQNDIIPNSTLVRRGRLQRYLCTRPQ